MQTSLHIGDWIASWVPSKDDMWSEFIPERAWPTLPLHDWYRSHDQYLSGFGDVVGYWAESRIFGGVVLFDRRDPQTCRYADPHSVWFHSDRREVTYCIYKLLDKQREQLLEFLGSESPDPAVLSILGHESNIRLEDPEGPIENTGIYRHGYEERKLRGIDDPPDR